MSHRNYHVPVNSLILQFVQLLLVSCQAFHRNGQRHDLKSAGVFEVLPKGGNFFADGIHASVIRLHALNDKKSIVRLPTKLRTM